MPDDLRARAARHARIIINTGRLGSVIILAAVFARMAGAEVSSWVLVAGFLLSLTPLIAIAILDWRRRRRG